MAALDIFCHSVDRITALFKESGGTRWVDLTFLNIRRESFVITLFLADHDDPRFAALAEFIAETWPEDAKAVEAAPAVDETDPISF